MFKRRTEETAKDVRNYYADEISTFFSEVDGPKRNVLQYKNTLESLISFCRGLHNDVDRLTRNLGEETKSNRTRQARIEELEQALRATEDNYAELRQTYTSMEEQHTAVVASLKTKYYDDMVVIKNDHKRETDRLIGQLLVNQDSTQSWPDDKIKYRFQELQRKIEQLASPSNREFVVPADKSLGDSLDPSHFLERAGRSKTHLFLKSSIWTILHRQFFSSPFGLGCLGPGRAHSELMELHRPLRKFFEGQLGSPTAAGSNLPSSSQLEELFYQNKLANNWRTATFKCIHAAVRTSDDGRLAAESSLLRQSTANTAEAISRITDLLTEVASLSNNTLQLDKKTLIQPIVDLSLEIALQFGLNLAPLQLISPNRKDRIEIGQDIQDCEDGDTEKGSFCVVDLVVFPGIQVLGNGQTDSTSKRTITACQIYPILERR